MGIHILEIVESALAKAGYKVLDGDRETVIVREAGSDTDYKIKVTEVAG